MPEGECQFEQQQTSSVQTDAAYGCENLHSAVFKQHPYRGDDREPPYKTSEITQAPLRSRAPTRQLGVTPAHALRS